MAYRSFALKIVTIVIVLIITITIALRCIYKSEDNIPVKNAINQQRDLKVSKTEVAKDTSLNTCVAVENVFNELGDLKVSKIEVVQDTSLNVWIALNKELYKYSSSGISKYKENITVEQIWGYDTLYFMAVSLNDNSMSGKVKTEDNPKVFSLGRIVNDKVEVLEECNSSFNFFCSSTGEKILINAEGEVKLNGVVVERLPVEKSPDGFVDIKSIRFSEEVKGSVWVWSVNKVFFRDVFGKSAILFNKGKHVKVSLRGVGISTVNNIIEPTPGTIYLAQNSYETKGIRLNYKINAEKVEILKDTAFEEKSITPLYHHRDKHGRLWVYNINPEELYYFSNGIFEQYSLSQGGLNPPELANHNFMLEDKGFIWLVKSSGQGINLLSPDGNLQSFDVNQGVNIENIQKIIKLPDDNILLVNEKLSNNATTVKERFQVINKNSAAILMAIKKDKHYDSLNTSGDILTNSKGIYFWVETKDKYRMIKKFNGKKDVDVLDAYKYRDINEHKNKILENSRFVTFGLDSDDKIWLVYQNNNDESRAAVIIGDGGFDEIGSLYEMYLDKASRNKKFSVQFEGSSFKVSFHEPDYLFIENRRSAHEGIYYFIFKEALIYKKKDAKTCELVSTVKLEDGEVFLSGFNRNPKGELYLITLRMNSEKDSYIFQNGELKLSKVSYHSQDRKSVRDQITSYKERVPSLAHLISNIKKCKNDVFVFTLKKDSLFIKTEDALKRFKNIPGESLVVGGQLSGAFFDPFGNIWISSGRWMKNNWIRIKKGNIGKVLEDFAVDACLRLSEQRKDAEADSYYREVVEREKRASRVVEKEKVGTEENLPSMTVSKSVKLKDNITAERIAVYESTVSLADTDTTDVKRSAGTRAASLMEEKEKGVLVASVKIIEKPDEKQYYDENLKKLISADEKQQKEAERFFLNCTSDAVAYLETKKESIKEENTRWKIEALLSRLK